MEEGAASFERANGRPALLALLEAELGGVVEPSAAHNAVVRRFPLVFTTNYDDLLERVAAQWIRGAGFRDGCGRRDECPDDGERRERA